MPIFINGNQYEDEAHMEAAYSPMLKNMGVDVPPVPKEEIKPPKGDERMVQTPNDVYTNQQLEKQDDAVLGGTEIANRIYVSPNRSYDTQLSPDEEAAYSKKFGPNDSVDYDMRGWYKANPDADPKAPGVHYPDTFKKPNHPTFSNQSQYSTDEMQGGTWSVEDGKDVFTPSAQNLKNMTPEELQDYFKRVEPNGILRMPLGSSTEPAGALKSPDGTLIAPDNSASPEASQEVDWSRFNQPFGELKDTNPEGAKIASIPIAKELGLEGSDINERDLNKAIDIGMSAGPGMIVGGRAAFPGDDFWRQTFKAASLENQGATPKEIQQATGLFRRTPNGRWVHEMSDEGMKLTDRDWRFGDTGKLSEFVEHPELFKAYPAIKDINFKVADADEPWLGGFNQHTNTLMVNPKKIPAGDEGLLDVITHELQHWVQVKEGFPRGGNPDDALKDVMWKLGSRIQEAKTVEEKTPLLKLFNDIAVNAKRFAEYMYERIPGEVEANATMARRKLTTQQRNEFPIEEFNKFMEGSDNTLSGGKYRPAFHYPDANTGASAMSAISPIRSAAIEIDGKLFEGVNHFEAIQKATMANANKEGSTMKSGFITREGKFVDRDEAARLVNMEGPLISEDVPHLNQERPEGWWKKLDFEPKPIDPNLPHK